MVSRYDTKHAEFCPGTGCPVGSTENPEAGEKEQGGAWGERPPQASEDRGGQTSPVGGREMAHAPEPHSREMGLEHKPDSWRSSSVGWVTRETWRLPSEGT